MDKALDIDPEEKRLMFFPGGMIVLAPSARATRLCLDFTFWGGRRDASAPGKLRKVLAGEAGGVQMGRPSRLLRGACQLSLPFPCPVTMICPAKS